MVSDFLRVGYGSFVSRAHIVNMRRRRRCPTETRELEVFYDNNLLLDLTRNRSCNSVIVLDSGHRVLSALSLEELEKRRDGDRGEEIARELDIRYDGIQEELGMQFTDIRQTGTTFYASTLEEARVGLAEKRELFK